MNPSRSYQKLYVSTSIYKIVEKISSAVLKNIDNIKLNFHDIDYSFHIAYDSNNSP